MRKITGGIEPEKEEETPSRKKKNKNKPQLETSCREHFCKGGTAMMLYALRSKTERGMRESPGLTVNCSGYSVAATETIV